MPGGSKPPPYIQYSHKQLVYLSIHMQSNIFLPIDKEKTVWYNALNQIGQFVTILSVNKTRTFGWALCAHFCFVGAGASIFCFGEKIMKNNTRYIVHAALIAALYAALTHAQNLLIPNSASMAIQFRASEALCVLAFFTPAAIPGLTIGCLLFNITYGAALPLDFLVGSFATLLAAWGMWLTRRVTVRNIPIVGLLLPALTNAALVGWELTAYIGGGFWLNALYVAIGEAAVLLTLGTLLYMALKSRGLDKRLFG